MYFQINDNMTKQLIIFLFLVFLGLSVGFAQQPIRKTIEYYPNGRLKSTSYSNGAYREYDYDKNGNRRIIQEIESSQAIIQNVVTEPFCVGSTITAVFNTKGAKFKPDNDFRLELSDATGSFTVPIIINEIENVQEGNALQITGTIPLNLSGGQGYKLRIKASNPEFVSELYPLSGLTINPEPIHPVAFTVGFSQHNNTIILTANTLTPNPQYQWLNNGTPIPNETNTVYLVDRVGQIQVRVSNSAGCSEVSEIFDIITDIPDEILKGLFKFYPNPTTQGTLSLTVGPLMQGKAVRLSFFNSQAVLLGEQSLENLQETESINFPAAAVGLYLIKVTLPNNRTLNYKIIKE